MQIRKSAAAVLLSLGMGALCVSGAKAQEGPPPPPGFYQQQWALPPGEYSEISRQGFHDGIEGARRDFQNHRQPNVMNRDEFRHPNVPRPGRQEYRDAFRRGYQVGVQHIYGRGY